MGLLLLNKPEKDIIIGIWEITEDIDTLLKLLVDNQHFTAGEIDTEISNFRNEHRIKEFLSVRILTQLLLNDRPEIIYHANNKPFLANNPDFQISISHTKSLATVILSKSHKVGIDVEKLGSRIEKISHKFIGELEMENLSIEQRSYHLLLHWCAKETIYKIYGLGELDFKNNIFIDPFLPQENGKFNGMINKDGYIEQVLLNYFTINDYVIVWGTENTAFDKDKI